MIPAPRRGALLIAAALILSACTSVQPLAPAPLGRQEQRTYLQQLERFQLNGRVAGAVGKEGFNSQLDLKQQGRESHVVLRSPLGFGSATVDVAGDSVQFRSSRGERLTGSAGLQALADRLGFEPPLQSLRYWLLGVPDPALPAVEEAVVEGQPHVFEQQGWRVTVAEPVINQTRQGAVQVPRRVTLERAPARLRIVVDKWQLG